MSSYQFHNTIVISGSFSELNGSGHGSAFTKVVPTFKAVEDSLLEEQLDTLADVSEQLDYDVPRPAARGGGGRSAYRKTTPFSFVTKKEPPSPLVFKQVQIVKKNVCLTWHKMIAQFFKSPISCQCQCCFPDMGEYKLQEFYCVIGH
jgi:hypothetical protein